MAVVTENSKRKTVNAIGRITQVVGVVVD
ncbi:MAG: hypothetical protein QG659_395, partial [Patescibacteria group bacterium]|nr:hypothetical protein [Patescibacteria group bacterium]